MILKYDVIIIGGGHAGCEAACAAAQMGAKTCLVTMDMNKIAQMSCNPAVGGIAKGQIVREIDALGGRMGIVTDASTIQFRMLNRSKGPAMWSPRAQCDREKFIWQWRHQLDITDNLDIWQDQACELITENKQGKIIAKGVKTIWGAELHAGAIAITAGTFLNGLMHIGRRKVEGGRIAEPSAKHLTESITRHGIIAQRMKTGTPVRIDKRSINFELCERQNGERTPYRFSYLSDENKLPELKQLPCWILQTNDACHEELRKGLPDSPLFNGQIQSIGPRYCPSVETKLVTFPDKDHHPLFLEPEGEDTNEMYLNGFSSSMPIDVQIKALKQIPALANMRAYRPGYAIEYDFFDPTQLKHSLESKIIERLFFAGQVNGTTGYEEAAGQGLVAGVNATCSCTGKEPMVMQRDESYIGVLIDDLVTKGVDEPYRMFTSRAEYRILLRQDDADQRLTQMAYNFGLASKQRLDWWTEKKQHIDNIITFCENFHIKTRLINPQLEQLGITPLTAGCRLVDLIVRPQIKLQMMAQLIPELQEELQRPTNRKAEIAEAAEIRMKYKGYIEREKIVAEKMHRLEYIKIKGKFDYPTMNGLSIEARQKLQRIQPETLGQASRIPGISPSDIDVMLVLSGR